MTHAYSELYIENAQKVFGHMLHYVIYDLGMKYDPYCRLFVQSGPSSSMNKVKKISAGQPGRQSAVSLQPCTAGRNNVSVLSKFKVCFFQTRK